MLVSVQWNIDSGNVADRNLAKLRAIPRATKDCLFDKLQAQAPLRYMLTAKFQLPLNSNW